MDLVGHLRVSPGLHLCGDRRPLFPNKSGGAAIYGAAAWVRYSKFIAPLSVWCNWLAWTPVLAIGSGIAAGYVLNALFAPDAAIRTWEFQLADLGFMKEGLKLRLNSTFFIGAILLLISFAIQHRNILSTARAQTIVGVAVLLPLLIVGFVPLITGECGDAAFQLTPSRRLFATRAIPRSRHRYLQGHPLLRNCFASRSTFLCRWPSRARRGQHWSR